MFENELKINDIIDNSYNVVSKIGKSKSYCEDLISILTLIYIQNYLDYKGSAKIQECLFTVLSDIDIVEYNDLSPNLKSDIPSSTIAFVIYDNGKNNLTENKIEKKPVLVYNKKISVGDDQFQIPTNALLYEILSHELFHLITSYVKIAENTSNNIFINRVGISESITSKDEIGINTISNSIIMNEIYTVHLTSIQINNMLTINRQYNIKNAKISSIFKTFNLEGRYVPLGYNELLKLSEPILVIEELNELVRFESFYGNIRNVEDFFNKYLIKSDYKQLNELLESIYNNFENIARFNDEQFESYIKLVNYYKIIIIDMFNNYNGYTAGQEISAGLNKNFTKSTSV